MKFKNALRNTIILLLLISVTGCGHATKQSNFCQWAKPLPTGEKEGVYEEMLSDEMIRVLYIYQREYNCSCLKQCPAND
jgi:hypothetical protein